MNLMILDDDEIIRLTYQSLLEEFEYKIISVSNYLEAKKNILEKDISLIILDLNMPDKYGVDLIEEFHTLNPSIKYIINTGDSNFRIPNELKKLGLDDNNNIITKPLFDINILVNKINKLVP